MMGHEASTLAREYGPQWINMPNFAARNQAVRSSSVHSLIAKLGKTDTAAAANPLRKNCRRFKILALIFLKVICLEISFLEENIA